MNSRTLLGVIAGLLSASSLQAAPEVGAAFATDPPVPFQYNVPGADPGVAFDGENYLVIFEDSGQIRGVRVDGDGAPLSIDWLRLDPEVAEESRLYPSVAFGGEHHLVAWTNGGSGFGIGAQLVNTQGQLVGDPIQISEEGYYPSVVWAGSSFVVAWMDFYDDAREVSVASLDLAGNVSERVRVSNSGEATEPSIAAASDMVLVSWVQSETDEVLAARISSTLEVLDPGGMSIGDGARRDQVSAGASADTFLVAWPEAEAGNLAAALIDSEGAVTPGLAVSPAGRETAYPAVAFEGEQFAVAWFDVTESPAQLVTSQVSTAGMTSEPQPIATIDPSSREPLALTPNGNGYFAAYQSFGVEGAMIDPDLGALQSGIPLSFVPQPQDSPSLAWDGTNYVLSWFDQRSGEQLFSGHAVRISPAGQALDPNSLTLTATASERLGWVTVMSTGNDNTMATWLDFDQGVSTRSIGSDGSLGEISLLSAEATSPLVLAESDGNYLILYRDTTLDPELSVVQAVDESGTLVGSPLALPEDIALDADGLLSVGTGLLVRHAGNQLAPVSLGGEVGSPISLPEDAGTSEAATNGTQSLISWRDASNAFWGRLYADGAWTSDLLALGEQASAGHAAWDGSQFAVVWSDDTEATHFRYVSLEGELTATETIVSADCNYPVIASNGEGQLLLTCTRWLEFSRSRRLDNRLLGAPVGDLVDLEEPDQEQPQTSDEQNPSTDDPDGATTPADGNATDADGTMSDSTGADSSESDSVASDAAASDTGTEASNGGATMSPAGSEDDSTPTGTATGVDQMAAMAGDSTTQSPSSGSSGCTISSRSQRSPFARFPNGSGTAVWWLAALGFLGSARRLRTKRSIPC